MEYFYTETIKTCCNPNYEAAGIILYNVPYDANGVIGLDVLLIASV